MINYILGFISFPLVLFVISQHDLKRINKLRDRNGAVKKQGSHL
jgi:hypothetical protein